LTLLVYTTIGPPLNSFHTPCTRCTGCSLCWHNLGADTLGTRADHRYRRNGRCLLPGTHLDRSRVLLWSTSTSRHACLRLPYK